MKQVKIRQEEIPAGWSLEAADFINKLIQRKPTSRLGLNGPDELKTHIWFKDYNWDSIVSKTGLPPFIPPKEDNFDAKYANEQWKDDNTDIMQKQIELEKEPAIQALFNGYYYMAMLDGNNGAGIVLTNSKAEENEAKPPASSDKTTRSNSLIK